MSPADIARLAHEHVERLKEDIEKCTTREDHIRVTARANEAETLLRGLVALAAVTSSETSSDL
jgi:hypothetical protein